MAHMAEVIFAQIHCHSSLYVAEGVESPRLAPSNRARRGGGTCHPRASSPFLS
jgi:hypothetical protein